MITHKGTKTIQTERMILRRFTVEDAQAMYENWACDDRVSRYVSWDAHQSPEETRKILTLWCGQYEKTDTYNWLMEYQGTPIGNISVVHVNEKNEWAEIGYCMGHAWWNQGLMTEAARAVIDFLFAEVGLHRIEIGHLPENPASGRVAQKCGLTLEGVRRQCFKKSDGRFFDVCIYGILRDEWEK